MPTIITMPAFSSTMETGKLIKWLVSEGDKIKSGQPIAEIETDKAVADIEATTDGYLARILISEPDTDIPVNEKMAIILGENEDQNQLDEYISGEPPQSREPSGNEENKINSARTRSDAKTSPGARRVADEAGIDITQVKGTGPKGRITKNDVLQYLSDSGTESVATPDPGKNSGNEDFRDDHGPNSMAISPMRNAIAQRLSDSKRNIPHFYIETDINLDNLMQTRAGLPVAGNKKASLNVFFIKAAALAVREVPLINSSWNDDVITRKASINIGIAVGIDEGLVVPVIEQADTKDIPLLSDESNQLIEQARNKQLPQTKIGNASITISNLGMYKINRFYAIINPPESCILALGAVTKKPVVINDGIHISNIMTCTMSADHRVIDGVTAARYLNSLKNLLENPSDWTTA